MNKKAGHVEKDLFTKFSISLSEDTEMFLDEVKAIIRDKSKVRVSRSEIIRAAIRYVKTLKPDYSNIKNENDLLEALISASRKK